MIRLPSNEEHPEIHCTCESGRQSLADNLVWPSDWCGRSFLFCAALQAIFAAFQVSEERAIVTLPSVARELARTLNFL